MAEIILSRYFEFKKNRFLAKKKLYENSLEDQWPFKNIKAISTPYRLYVNGSPEGPFSNCGSGITQIILSRFFEF